MTQWRPRLLAVKIGTSGGPIDKKSAIRIPLLADSTGSRNRALMVSNAHPTWRLEADLPGPDRCEDRSEADHVMDEVPRPCWGTCRRP